LIVPEFCLLECTNVIWKQVRFNGMSIKDAKDNLKSIRLLKLKRVPMKRLLERTLEIAVKHNLAVYDSSYIALGLHLNYPLITIDEKQAKIAQAEGVTLIPITNFNL
ncbi:MAG: type II toxin-antitoxin system VapC family toxin, partial [Anaerolineae bacterium]|nr:type II toxin-antitoxin system VapC family toxin [Anaerolineae bacterium]